MSFFSTPDPRTAAGHRRRLLLRTPRDQRHEHLLKYRSYCLYCFTTLPTLGVVCPNCQQHDHAADHRFFWNRAPRLVRLRRIIQGIGVLISLLVTIALLMTFTSIRDGYLVGIPLGFCLVVDRSAAALNRHSPYFQPGLVWLTVGFIGAYFSFRLMAYSFEVATVGLFLLATGYTALVWMWRRRFRAWKRRLMEQGPASD